MYFLLGLYMLSRSFFRNISHCIFIKMRYLWFTSFCVLHTQHTALFLTTTSSVDNTDKILSTPRTPHNECSSWLYIVKLLIKWSDPSSTNFVYHNYMGSRQNNPFQGHNQYMSPIDLNIAWMASFSPNVEIFEAGEMTLTTNLENCSCTYNSIVYLKPNAPCRKSISWRLQRI